MSKISIKTIPPIYPTGGGIHTQLLPFNLLTEKERNLQKDKAKELLRFLQTQGFRVVGYKKKYGIDLNYLYVHVVHMNLANYDFLVKEKIFEKKNRHRFMTNQKLLMWLHYKPYTLHIRMLVIFP